MLREGFSEKSRSRDPNKGREQTIQIPMEKAQKQREQLDADTLSGGGPVVLKQQRRAQYGWSKEIPWEKEIPRNQIMAGVQTAMAELWGSACV